MMRRFRNKSGSNERGAEAAAMIIVLPVLIVLILSLIDIGLMFRTRIVIQNEVNGAVRAMAAEGGNLNPRATADNIAWSTKLRNRIANTNNTCRISTCVAGQLVTVDCNDIISPTGALRTADNTTNANGEYVRCTVRYPYRAINQRLLSSPLGLGMGRVTQPFTVQITARSEVNASQ
jgi:Flp pilus assembly protein TadG